MAQETTWNGNWRFDCENGVLQLKDDTVYVQRCERVQDHNILLPPTETIAPVKPDKTGQDYLLDEFLHAVCDGKLSATSCQDNIHSLNIVFSVIGSFETGQSINLGGKL